MWIFNDTARLKQLNNNDDVHFKDFSYFYHSKHKSILFCAVKHREGSDIPYLTVVFMDLVEKTGRESLYSVWEEYYEKDKKKVLKNTVWY